MESKYKQLCKGLAIVVLVVGVVGSIIAANQYGVVKDVSYSAYAGISTTTKRNASLTFMIFVSGIFSTGILYVILAGLGEVLEYLEMLSKKNNRDGVNSFQQSELPPL